MTTRRAAFTRWRTERPFWGAVLIALGGIEEFFSGQLDIGKIHVQLGLEGLQAAVIPAVLVLLAVLILLMPVHRIFYGIIALLLSLYSLIGVNLGGFIIGMLLSSVGGVLAVAWMPRKQAVEADPGADAAAEQPREASVHSRVLHGDGHAEPVIPPSLGKPGETGRRASATEAAPRGRRVLRGGAAAAVAALALAAAAVAPQSAQAADASAVQAGCVLLIICSPSSSPSPTPSTSAPSAPPSTGDGSSSGSGGSPVQTGPGGTIIQVPGQSGGSVPAPGQQPVTQPPAASDPTTQTPLVALGADNDHGIFTTPSANTWGDSIQISGPSQAGVVTVPLANGSRATAIRIECDQLTIGNFHLDSSNRQELVNLDTSGMTLKGHAVIWVDRIGTQYGDGVGLEQSLAANPLTLEALMTLLGQGHTVLGLVGAQADSLSYDDFHETAALQSSGVPSGN
ncbi:DUF6114 domain-containing protein [Gryllotalpicola protaetiae]|uniref:DUF6114 domain-containing protein n=1 Tax=Gryllotalpicola protaetiae TaxID=2419771 RepID=UPI0015E8B5BC|nr:DUF6114 domain-containing protein [Gryllotalpicola protaetiae]